MLFRAFSVDITLDCSDMDPHVLLTQLKAHIGRAPSFADFSATSAVHQEWLGRSYALVKRWNSLEASSLKVAADSLASLTFMREGNLGSIFGVLNRAISDLELQLPVTAAQAFGPGAVYDFFKALNSVVSSAQSSLFIIDPYLDDTVFDAYLSGVPKQVSVRLLVEGYAAKVTSAIQRFVAQFGIAVEARRSPSFHDRVIFVDSSECWVLGMSIRKAAEAKPTYLAPLSSDIAALKLGHYEQIWSGATAI
ncbi:phospholipase D-like domain-containing protein [Hylemonella gracilis]|uniref:Uncharacterized protein n=1 Tax=Hylemonella gracilis ATCC 19624 TaxID=887062 RepID=F3KTQ9_9BURK|nr:hypothetical protein [Hylemonella gracilis]EGI76938.1 hypothetical protein HGR_09199 [Hylemonella gracilis ATCC 19624]